LNSTRIRVCIISVLVALTIVAGICILSPPGRLLAFSRQMGLNRDIDEPPASYTGQWQTWYANGKTESIGQYRNGLLNGMHLSYSPKGHLSGEGRYLDGKPCGNHLGYNAKSEVVFRCDHDNRSGDKLKTSLTPDLVTQIASAPFNTNRAKELLGLPYILSRLEDAYDRPEWIYSLITESPSLHRMLILTFDKNDALLECRMFDKDCDHNKSKMTTLLSAFKKLGAEPAMVAVLHTWGQTLSVHPHTHIIFSGTSPVRASNSKTSALLQIGH